MQYSTHLRSPLALKPQVSRCEARTGSGVVRLPLPAVGSPLTGMGHLSHVPGDLWMPERVAVPWAPSDSVRERIWGDADHPQVHARAPLRDTSMTQMVHADDSIVSTSRVSAACLGPVSSSVPAGPVQCGEDTWMGTWPITLLLQQVSSHPRAPVSLWERGRH